MNYTLNVSGTISTPNTPVPLWAAGAAGTRAFIQNRSIGALTVIVTPATGGIDPVSYLLLQESYLDETQFDVTAAASVSGNVAGIQFTAYRGN